MGLSISLPYHSGIRDQSHNKEQSYISIDIPKQSTLKTVLGSEAMARGSTYQGFREIAGEGSRPKLLIVLLVEKKRRIDWERDILNCV